MNERAGTTGSAGMDEEGRKLEDAGNVTTHRNGSGVTARTSVALTGSGRAALERYTTVLRQLLDSASQR
jgi:predicted MarR family transcription regulator